MDEERLLYILNDEDDEFPSPSFKRGEPCTILAGLNIIANYLPLAGIGAAGHDILYSDAGTEELIKAGITEEDAIKLRGLGWMIDEGSLAAFT